MSGMKCPKCRLMQMPRPTCKSCGAPLASKVPQHAPAQASAALSPSTARKGPIYMREEPPPPAFTQESPIVTSIAPEPAPRGTQATPPPVTQPRPPSIGPEAFQYHGGTDGHAHEFFFHGTGGSLFGIYIVKILLSLLTLGVYYFWGKTKERNYMWSQTDFAGDRFAYHGTGKELLIGFLKAVVLFFLPLAALIFALYLFLGSREAVEPIAALVYGIAMMVVFPVAMVGARRYRYSRTSWRGIFFSFRGSVKELIKIFVSGSLLSFVTAGLYYPFFETKKYGFFVSNAYFGSQKFEFTGRGRDLFTSFLLTLLLLFPTLGMYWFWFEAKKQRYFWANTTIGGARFCSTATGGALLLLRVGNFFLTLLTLSLGRPWVWVRNARFFCRHVTVEGPLDLTSIEQESQVATATGEGLASFLDMDSGFDFG